MKNTIIVKNIDKEFVQGNKTFTLFAGLNATFDQHHSYAITGVSGVGKSTLLHIITGLEQPTRGHVYCNDRDITTLNSAERSSFLYNSVGQMFQKAYLIRELSVLENVMIKGLMIDKDITETENRGLEVLEYVGMAHKAQAQPGSLSGGEQQRVAFARALFIKPHFLIADEPTAHLDAANRDLIIALLQQCKELSVGLIISTHDYVVAQAMDIRMSIQDKRLFIESSHA